MFLYTFIFLDKVRKIKFIMKSLKTTNKHQLHLERWKKAETKNEVLMMTDHAENHMPSVNRKTNQLLLQLQKGLPNERLLSKLQKIRADRSIVGDGCFICDKKYKKNQFVLMLPCGHVIHYSCREKWLKTASTCPTCK